MDPNHIEHLADHAFQAALPEGRAVLEYSLSADRMLILHTRVPPELRGRGLAGKLVRAALDHARAQGLRVEPRCSYAAEWIARHPEYAELVAAGA